MCYGVLYVYEGDWSKFGWLGMFCGVFDVVGVVVGCLIVFVVIYGFVGVLDFNLCYIDMVFLFSCVMVWVIVLVFIGIVCVLYCFDMVVYVEVVVFFGCLLVVIIIWWIGLMVVCFLFVWVVIDFVEIVCYWGMVCWFCLKVVWFGYFKDWWMVFVENLGIECFFMVIYVVVMFDVVMCNGLLFVVGGFVSIWVVGFYCLVS